MRHKKIHSFFILLAMILLITTVAYAADPLTITTSSLPRGQIGESYSAQLTAAGGEGDYQFDILLGTLPQGLELSSDGVISGIPEDGGLISIYFSVKDSANHTATKRIFLRITAKTVNFTINSNYHEYNGSPQTVIAVPDVSEITEDDYTITYNGLEEAINIGNYDIEIKGAGLISKGYRVGTISPRQLIIAPNSSSSITLSSQSFEYDGTPHGLTPVVEPAEIQNDYKVTYRGRGNTEYAETEQAPSEVGTYTVTATTTNANYVVRTATASLTITAPKVDFVVSNVNTTYNGQPQQATVSPGTYTGGYTVTYDDVSTAEVEAFASVTDAGQYNINIALDDPNHQVGTMNFKTFVINPRPIDFTVSENDVPYQQGVDSYAAQITPSVSGFTDYKVVYTKGGAESLGSVSAAGEYDIRIELDDTADEKTGRNNVVRNVTPNTFRVGKLQVGFTVTDNNVDFDPNSESNDYAAVVTPNIVGFTDYKVIYVDSTNGRHESKVTEVGTYTIEIEFTGANAQNYELSSITPNTFTVNPVTVNFTVTGETVDYSSTVTEYEASVAPSVDGFTDYTVTYVKDGTSYEKVTEAGVYEIQIELTEAAKKHYQKGTVDQDTFTVNPLAVDFAVSDETVDYVPGTTDYKATITPSITDFTDYAVIYVDEKNVEHEGSVAEVGEYTIKITLTGDNAKNYQVGDIIPNTFTVNKTAVNFAISDETVNYSPTVTEYEATVAPSVDGFTDYTVTYVKDGTSYEKVTEAGVYEIQIELTGDGEANYRLGTVIPNEFTVNPCRVDFAVSKNSVVYNPDATGYAAVVAPSIDGFKDFTVTYVRDEEVYENEINITDLSVVGEYTINIAVNDANYSLGDVTGGTTFTVSGPAADLVLGGGNSPAARIGTDEAALAAFMANHEYNGITYSVAAWGAGDNLDEDQTAYFIIDGKANWDELTWTATYSDGRAVAAADMNISVNGESPEAWLAAAPASGVYEMTYSFTDNNESAETVTATRKLVLLNQMGDVNSDSNINAGDARFLQAQVLAAPTEQEALYLYRVCDVNHDGIVDESDAAAIMNRMNVPLTAYYPAGK